MILTNKFNLPQPLVNALTRDIYSKGDAKFSATGLHVPPQAIRLLREHGDTIEKDISDDLDALFGKIVHKIIEEAAENELDNIAEKRLYMEIDDVRISGKFDNFILTRGELDDYKYTKKYAGTFGVRPDYIGQLNVYAQLLRANEFVVTSLKNIYMYKDWSRADARRKKNYPQSPILYLDIELWPEAQTIEHIRQRMEVYKNLDVLCTEDERWKKEDNWAVIKRGNVRASPGGVHGTEQEAIDWANENVPKTKLYDIDHRRGENTRCEDWCNARTVCPQWAAIQSELASVDQGVLNE